MLVIGFFRDKATTDATSLPFAMFLGNVSTSFATNNKTTTSATDKRRSTSSRPLSSYSSSSSSSALSLSTFFQRRFIYNVFQKAVDRVSSVTTNNLTTLFKTTLHNSEQLLYKNVQTTYCNEKYAADDANNCISLILTNFEFDEKKRQGTIITKKGNNNSVNTDRTYPKTDFNFYYYGKQELSPDITSSVIRIFTLDLS